MHIMNTLTGQVQIAEDVIASIASAAVLEVEGALGLTGNFRRKRQGRGVTLQVKEEKVRVSLDISVNSGVKIQNVARNVQEKVRVAIETMTGYKVLEVNINVNGLIA